MRFVLLTLFCTGCIAASVKAHTGVVTDERNIGFQAGVSVGIGYAGKRSAVLESIGFAGGQSPKAGLAIGLDYVRLPEDRDDKIGWRVGFGALPLTWGNPAMSGIRVGTLLLVRDHSSYGGHEKSFSESTRVAHAVGIEGMIGASIYDQYKETRETTFGGAASVSYELYMLSRLY